MKRVVLLGSTGSIGTSTIKVAEDLPSHIQLIGLAAGNNVQLLREQARKFSPALVSVADPARAAISFALVSSSRITPAPTVPSPAIAMRSG